VSVVFATVPSAALAPALDESKVAPGLLGFLVVVALGIALFFLIRSMNKQISKIQAPKEEELKQAEWEQRQAAGNSGGANTGGGTSGRASGSSDGDA
jgi:hypothetical protein